MIERMLPIAVGIEAAQMRNQFNAVGAAIAGAFQRDGAKPFLALLDRVQGEISGARDGKGPKVNHGASSAKEMMGIFGQMGFNTRPPSRPKGRSSKNG